MGCRHMEGSMYAAVTPLGCVNESWLRKIGVFLFWTLIYLLFFEAAIYRGKVDKWIWISNRVRTPFTCNSHAINFFKGNCYLILLYKIRDSFTVIEWKSNGYQNIKLHIILFL